MPRDSSVYLEDILGAIAKVKRYTGSLSGEVFATDDKTIDVDVDILWDVVRNKLPALEHAVESLLREQEHS